MSDLQPAATTGNRKFTKARALLAGGLVLGVGAAVTLAAWNDSEFATGTFEAGTFGIEGAADGGTFAEHTAAESAANLTFEVNATTLTPNDVVYAGYAVKLIETSNYAADVNVVSALDGANAANLTSSYVYTNAAGCDAEAYAGGTNANVDEFTLDATESPTFVCIQVTAGENLVQGAAATIAFEFAATSTAELV